MTTTNKPGLDADERTLLDTLDPDGSTRSNHAIQDAVGWDLDHYVAVRNRLIDAGWVVLGPGRGGTVRRVVEAATGSGGDDSADSVAGSRLVGARYPHEPDLYPPMRDVIAGDWAKVARMNPLAVEITAFRGRRDTGGIWSRPDITSVEIRTFTHVPGKYLEIVTFEVKPADAINAQCVYEALAQRRWATRAYVLLHIPDRHASVLEPMVGGVAEVARTHGIGVITAADPEHYRTWDEREAAARVQPDPEYLDTFVATQLSDDVQDDIARRLH